MMPARHPPLYVSARWRTTLVAACAVGLLGPGSPVAAQSGAAVGSIAGVARTASGSPVAGAQVTLPDLGMGSLTDASGVFRIENVPEGRHTLTAIGAGYAPLERRIVVAAGEQTTVDLQLRPEVFPLDGIVVTGAPGTARRREIGHSFVELDATELPESAIGDVTDLLQGRVPGATILENSGQVGAGPMLRIRGNNSLVRPAIPLVYVDGIRVNGEAYQTDRRINQAASPLRDINPEDIERIEVLKGAAATTLYGTEAASGVIQIFTKRGQAGPPRWALSVEQGLNSMGHVGPPESSNPTGLGLNRCNSNADPMFPPDPSCPASGSWLRSGWLQRYNLSVGGGSERVTYYVSGRWADEQGAFDGRANGGSVSDPSGRLGTASQGARSWNVRGNFGFAPRPGVDVRFHTAYARQEIDWISDGNTATGLPINVMRGARGYTGNLGDGLVTTEDVGQSVDHLITSVGAVWAPSPRFTHRLNAGLDWSQSDLWWEAPWGHFVTSEGVRDVQDISRRELTLDYAGTWSGTVGGFTSTLAWSGQLHDDHQTGLIARGERFAGPGNPLVQSAQLTQSAEIDTRIKSGGFFVQETLGWADRLFLTGGLRFDSHAAFGKDVSLEVYPKASVSYVASDEEFIPEWVSMLRLRGAIGEAGDAGGPFDAAKTFEHTSADEQELAVTTGSLGNPDLGPERSLEWELGLDGSLFEGRVSVDYTYYSQRTRGALVAVPQVPSAGFPGRRIENIGELRNSGHEAFVAVEVLRRDDLTGTLGIRLATNRSEVVDLGPEVESIPLAFRNDFRLGEPAPSICDRDVANADEVGVEPVYVDACQGSAMPTHT